MTARAVVVAGIAARALIGVVVIVVAYQEAAGLFNPAPRAGSIPAATISTASPLPVETPPPPVVEWVPTPQAGLSRPLQPGESYKAPPVEAIRALARIPAELELDAIRVGMCESGWNAAERIIDVDGLPREGAFMVGAIWHGAVPADLPGQAEQFARIVESHGLWPFTTRDGCPRWREN